MAYLDNSVNLTDLKSWGDVLNKMQRHRNVPQLTAIAVLNCIVNMAGLAVNISVFIGITKSNLPLRLKVYLANMTVADLFTSIVIQPMFTATLILDNGLHLLIVDLINSNLWLTILPISLLALTAVSIERSILIYYPLRSDLIMPSKVAIGISVLIWILSPTLQISIIFTKNPGTSEATMNLMMLLIVLSLIAIHFKIFITARKIRRHTLPEQQTVRRIAEIKQVFITTGMFITIFISYMPYLVVRLVVILGSKDDITSHVIPAVMDWLILLITIGMVLKQCLLGILNRDIRSAILRQWTNFAVKCHQGNDR